ncbi:MAG: histidinol-phosphate transaminase [Bacteroidaceae bacterium]|nr:histidinol-phosphate transaminase [Bacteroidaceae bacterium]
MKNLDQLVRPNIWRLTPYSCARDEFKGRDAHVFLDANENPYNAPLNRYPDPLQEDLKRELEQVKGVPSAYTFLGNGSDEAIDLIYRVFCQPCKDNVVAISPTYGMYQVCAHINDVEYRPVLLDDGFQLNADRLLAATDERTKVIWICSPNNPTGNAMQRSEIERVLTCFEGIVVVDEAYSDFNQLRPFRFDLPSYPNLIVLNTFSKAWASAAIRLGIAYASPQIVTLLNKVKYPYNVNLLTQRQASEMLRSLPKLNQWLSTIRTEREHLLPAVAELSHCRKVYPTDANFFLARFDNADQLYHYLVERGIIVRNRSRVALCEGCLRITVGTPQENCELLAALRQYKA